MPTAWAKFSGLEGIPAGRETCKKKPMRTGLRLLAFALLFAQSGCHVVRRSEQCGHLAAALRGAKDELSEPLTETPTAAALKKKAAAYSKLAATLRQLPTESTAVQEQRLAAISALQSLDKELRLAAGAVERRPKELAQERKKEEARQKRREAIAKKAERRRKAKAQLLGTAETPHEEAGTSKKRADKKEPKAQKKPPRRTFSNTPTVREYRRAKLAIEAAGKKLKGTMKRLQVACNTSS